MINLKFSAICSILTLVLEASNGLPTLYEYYTLPTIKSGLSADQPYFTLNGRNITLYSGTMHYFRVPKAYWRDRLRKIRAAGLNAVETYIPWNLHEPQKGVFDFGNGGSDWEDFLDLKEFFTIAKEEDLLAIARPGPFICAEWEFGGMPSWLLRTKDIKVRTSETNYMNFVTEYFNALLPILAGLQFTKGGPIVVFQIENEYGSTEGDGFTPDKVYLQRLVDLYKSHGITELLVSSDSPSSHADRGSLPGLLQTANFGGSPIADFNALKKLQPNKPIMAMEFWSGWFDHWSEEHHTRNNEDFGKMYEQILSYPGSGNFYMFHGGTSFGFLNGANLGGNSDIQPDTNSYDYDAPLSEAGDYTEKYEITQNLIEKYNVVKTKVPARPSITEKVKYSDTQITEKLPLDEILEFIPNPIPSEDVLAMEHLPINNNSGQSYGYILYRKENIDIPENAVLTIEGRICDTVVVLVNGILMSNPILRSADLDVFGTWRTKNSNLTLGPTAFKNATLDLLVENWGRVNFGYLSQFNQFKGLWQGSVLIDNNKISDWSIYPLEFRKNWNNNLSGWSSVSGNQTDGPVLYKATLDIPDPKDSFIDMEDWGKGVVIVNGFVLGRYVKMGPQQTLYLPAPLLKNGTNTFLIFEHYTPTTKIVFSDKPRFKTN